MIIYSKNNSVCVCHASLVHDRARQRTLPCPVWLCGCVIMTTILDLPLFPPGKREQQTSRPGFNSVLADQSTYTYICVYASD